MDEAKVLNIPISRIIENNKTGNTESLFIINKILYDLMLTIEKDVFSICTGIYNSLQLLQYKNVYMHLKGILSPLIANDFDLRKYGIPWGTRLGVLIPVFLLLSIIITLIKSNLIINIVIEWSGISCLYNRCC
jgi:hypothetical protein